MQKIWVKLGKNWDIVSVPPTASVRDFRLAVELAFPDELRAGTEWAPRSEAAANSTHEPDPLYQADVTTALAVVLQPNAEGDFKVHVDFDVRAAKRARLEQKPFYFNERANAESDHKARPKYPVLRRLPDYADVTHFTDSDQRSSFLFGIQQYLPELQKWIAQLRSPISSTQRKDLLLVHGPVKSGKTTLIRDVLPHLLQESMAEFEGKPFCFAYIDLSPLAPLHKPEDKWRQFLGLLDAAFPGQLSVVDPKRVLSWHVEVSKALSSLSRDQWWFIALDGFHQFFSGLDHNQTLNVAACAKGTFLDNDSPCHFVLCGSAQASFWSAMNQASNSGLRMLFTACILTIPFDAKAEEMQECSEALVKLGTATAEDVRAAQQLLFAQKTPVNLAQVVANKAKYGSVEAAYEMFLRSKQAVFLKNHAEFPLDEIVEQLSLGSILLDNKIHSFLLGQRGDLSSLRDADFRAFLAQFYDPKTKKIAARDGVFPIVDIMMFLPLLSWEQQQQKQQNELKKVDESKFEAQAAAFALAHFETAKEGQFKAWLASAAAGDSIDPLRQKNANPEDAVARWVEVVQMLRSKVSLLQREGAWEGLAAIKAKVLDYMKTPMHFHGLLQCYEECRIVEKDLGYY